MNTHYKRAVPILVALALVQLSALPLLAQGTLSLKAVQTETTAVGQFTNSFLNFQNEYSRLMATKATRLQIQTFQSTGTTLKDSVPMYRSSLSAYISKLKAAALWTTNLDLQCEQNIIKMGYGPTVVNKIRRSGGFRALAEWVSKASANLPAMIDEQLKQVSSKGAISWYDFGLAREAYAVVLTENQKKGLKCGLSILFIAAAAVAGQAELALGGALYAIDTCPDVDLKSMI